MTQHVDSGQQCAKLEGKPEFSNPKNSKIKWPHLNPGLPISLFDGIHFVCKGDQESCHKNNENPTRAPRSSPEPPALPITKQLLPFFCQTTGRFRLDQRPDEAEEAGD